jgi:carbamoyl-phosphate synthase large subunit
VTLCFDKFDTAKQLQTDNVPTPESVLIESSADIEAARDRFGLNFWLRSNTGGGGRGSLHVENRSIYDLVNYWIDEYDGWGEFAAWEYLPGANYGVDSLWKNGEPVLSHVKRRGNYGFSSDILSSVSGATNVIHSLSDSDERQRVLETAHNAVRSVAESPNGLFTVDLKADSNEIPKVTELNPGRFLGTSGLYFGYTDHPLPKIYLDIGCNGSSHQSIKNVPEGNTLLRFFDQPPIVMDTDKYTGITGRSHNMFKVY